MSTHTLDTIGRKVDALIDVLLGRPVKVKGPTNEELVEIVKQWENAAPGTIVDIPDGMGWPPICNQRSSKHDGELAAAEAQAKLNRLLADVARVKVGDVRAAFDAYHQGLADMSQARIDRLLANAQCEIKPEATTTELECAGIDQYAIEIENAGGRIRYEAPSAEGVVALIRAHDRVDG